MEAPASLPGSTGDYRIVGLAEDGEELFSLPFEMPEVADGDGGSSFAFTLPIEPGWAEELAGVTLSGPGGAVTMDEDTNRPVTILRNPATGQVRGILRDRPAGRRRAGAGPGGEAGACRGAVRVAAGRGHRGVDQPGAPRSRGLAVGEAKSVAQTLRVARLGKSSGENRHFRHQRTVLVEVHIDLPAPQRPCTRRVATHAWPLQAPTI